MSEVCRPLAPDLEYKSIATYRINDSMFEKKIVGPLIKFEVAFQEELPWISKSPLLPGK